jgi:DNA (cytosine-5)-methyltransferase 1
MTVPISRVIGLCQVYVRASVPELEAWLEMSPYHFYACYAFPSLNVTSWDHRHRLEPRDLLVCRYCAAEDLTEWKHNREFLKKHKPLRTLDPFAGSGSFGLGMERTGCVKITHAVEISPSAAKTLKYVDFSLCYRCYIKYFYRANSPDTVVYNQCSNLVLREAIKAHAGIKLKGVFPWAD